MFIDSFWMEINEECPCCHVEEKQQVITIPCEMQLEELIEQCKQKLHLDCDSCFVSVFDGITPLYAEV